MSCKKYQKNEVALYEICIVGIGAVFFVKHVFLMPFSFARCFVICWRESGRDGTCVGVFQE